MNSERGSVLRVKGQAGVRYSPIGEYRHRNTAPQPERGGMVARPVPRSASSALKGNCFSSATMSSEIAKAGRSPGAAGRRLTNPPQKPSAKLKRAKPQRRLQARPEKPLALCRVEPRPSQHRGLNTDRRAACRVPLKSGLSKKQKPKTENPQYPEGPRSRGPPGSWRAQRDPATDHRSAPGADRRPIAGGTGLQLLICPPRHAKARIITTDDNDHW